MEVLSRRDNYNPVLVGNPGVGKSTVVKGLARKIVQGEVPETLRNKQIYTMSLAALMADTRARNDVEERLKKVLKEIRARDDIILFIEKLHTLLSADNTEDAIGVASILRPIIVSFVPVILEATLDEYRKYVKEDSLLEPSFQLIHVAEPTISDTIEILEEARDRYEAYHRVSITDGALVASAQLADRYISDRFLPGKAIDLIDAAGSRVRIRRATASPNLRKYDEKIAQVRREKESAINTQDFEKATALGDKEKQLIAEKKAREKKWKAGDMDVVAEVNEELIAETVSRLQQLGSAEIADRNGSIARIFVSYRREDSAYPSSWLFDKLAQHFGPNQGFKDINSIQPGDDFGERITAAVERCDVLLALIGRQWLTICDEVGRRRLDNPRDFVRLEIEAAITRNVQIVPILLDGARMPHTDELPPCLVKLARRQAIELSPNRFDSDADRLLTNLDRALTDVQASLEYRESRSRADESRR